MELINNQQWKVFSAWSLLGLALVAGVGGPVVYVMLGDRHCWAFLFGMATGALNAAALVILGVIAMTGESPLRRGLIFVIVLKYPLLGAALVWGLMKLRLPPLTLVAGVLVVFPAVFMAFWMRNRGAT